MIFKLALRNVLRNKRRSVLIVIGIGLGTIILLLFKGYMEYSYFGLRLGAIQQYGHFQIAPRAYWAPTDFKKKLISAETLNAVVGVLETIPEISTYTPSLSVGGIVGTPYASTPFVAAAIEPDKALGTPTITSGTRLLKGDKDKVLLGKTLARLINVGVGDYVTVLANTLDGAINAGSLQVVGLITTGRAEADRRIAIVPISFAQDMLSTEGVESLLVTLKHTEKTAAVAQRLQARFDEMGIKLQIKTWDELATLYHQVRNLYDAIFTFALISISLLAFISILEIMTMSFFERLREIGTMMAIGTKRNQIFRLILTEGVLLGLIGASMGLVGGQVAAEVINTAHITYTPPGGSSPVPLGINLSLEHTVVPLVIVFGAALLSSVFPSLRAAKLNIVEVMYRV